MVSKSRALCFVFMMFHWNVSDSNSLCFECNCTFVTNALFVLCLIVTLGNRALFVSD